MRRDIAKALADHITGRTCTLTQTGGRCAIFIDSTSHSHFYGGTWKAAVKCLERHWPNFEHLYAQAAGESGHSSNTGDESAPNSTDSPIENTAV